MFINTKSYEKNNLRFRVNKMKNRYSSYVDNTCLQAAGIKMLKFSIYVGINFKSSEFVVECSSISIFLLNDKMIS